MDPVDLETEVEEQGPPTADAEPFDRGERVTEDVLVEVGENQYVVVAAGGWVPAELVGKPRHPGTNPPV